MDCFVIMPFSSEFNDVYDAIKMAVGAQEILRCGRIDEIRRPGSILVDLVKEIESASVCIADLTGNRPNVLWEVGYAMALNKPTILISQDISSLPFDLAPHRTLEYSRQDLAGTLRPKLLAALSSLDGSTPSTESVRTWRSVAALLDQEYSPAALEEVLDHVARVTGQRRPKFRLWGNCRAMAEKDRELFDRVGRAVGEYCAKRGFPVIGSSDDDRTLEVVAAKGACDYLRLHPEASGLDFIVHYTARGEGSRPEFGRAAGELPENLHVAYVEYPYRDGRRLQRVRTVSKSERENEHDARLGSMLQADIVVLLGAGGSAYNMLELVASIEDLRLRAARPHLLIPLPWVPGMGRVVFEKFHGTVDWRLLGCVEGRASGSSE